MKEISRFFLNENQLQNALVKYYKKYKTVQYTFSHKTIRNGKAGSVYNIFLAFKKGDAIR